jgi:DNA-directed RNA polymerase subunit RPC12/RpoP
VVARHTRRTGRRGPGGCVCIDCGTRYLVTNTYKGNYCPACHETWVARHRGDDSTTPPSPRLGPSRRPAVEADEDPDDETNGTDDPEDTYASA